MAHKDLRAKKERAETWVFRVFQVSLEASDPMVKMEMQAPLVKLDQLGFVVSLASLVLLVSVVLLVPQVQQVQSVCVAKKAMKAPVAQQDIQAHAETQDNRVPLVMQAHSGLVALLVSLVRTGRTVSMVCKEPQVNVATSVHKVSVASTVLLVLKV